MWLAFPFQSRFILGTTPDEWDHEANVCLFAGGLSGMVEAMVCHPLGQRSICTQSPILNDSGARFVH